MNDVLEGMLRVLLFHHDSDGWTWFHANKREKLFKIRKGWFRLTVRVKHLEPVFEELFGEKP